MKTQKACEQGRKANIGPQNKQTTSILPYIISYTTIKQNKSFTYVELGLFSFGSYVNFLCYY